MLGLVLWPNIWPIWVNVPCVLEEDISSAVSEYSVLEMSLGQSGWELKFIFIWVDRSLF